MVLGSEKSNKFFRTRRMGSTVSEEKKRMFKRDLAVHLQIESNNSWNHIEHAVLTICCVFIQLVLTLLAVFHATSVLRTTISLTTKWTADRPMD